MNGIAKDPIYTLFTCYGRHWVAFICSLLWLSGTDHVSGQQYNRTEFTLLNGIGQGDINHFSQDSFGYIWITQLNGLSRFNGHAFKNIPAHPTDSTGLPTAEVRHIHHLADGNAWISTANGLVYFDRKLNRFKTYNKKDGLHHSTVLFSYPAGDSMIVAATHFGYDLLDLRSGKIEWVRPFPNVPDSVWGHRSPNSVLRPKINPFRTHEIWSLHRNNLYALDLKTHQIRPLTNFQMGKDPMLANVQYLLEYEWLDAQHLVLNFFPNTGQLYVYDVVTKQLTPYPLSTSTSLWMNGIKKVSENKMLCLEFAEGPFLLDLDKRRLIPLDSTSRNNAYTTFFREKDGTIWVGERGIVYRYSPTAVITHYTEEENVFLYHIADPQTGTVIAYTYTDALPFLFKDGAFQPLSFPPLHHMPNNTFFHPYAGEFIYVYDQDFVRFHPFYGSIKRQNVKGISKTGIISDFEAVPEGFYMAILNYVFFSDLQGHVTLVFEDSLHIEDISFHNGTVYYSTLGAVRAYDIGEKQITDIYRLGQDLFMYAEVVADKLWFGWGKQLFYFELENKSAGYTQTDILNVYPDMHIHQLHEAEGKVLASASFMLMEIDCCPARVIKTFSYRDNIHMGYWDDAFTRLQNGYFISTDTRKMVAFPYSMPAPEIQSYLVEDIEVNGVRLQPASPSHTLRYDENDIFITSDVVYTGPPDQLIYFYRNSRTSDQWLPAKSHVLQLLDQRPGKYAIDLRVMDRHGHERIIPQAFVFDIRPPWYRSTLFYVIVAFLFIAIAYWLYRFRIRQVQNTFEIQHKLQQLEVTALKAQMNPHFIFNCLNSIKGLILIGETEKAVSYIGTFSKLVRSSLDSVEEKLITLREEFEIAENYLSLERLRYGSRLTWTIRAPDETLPERVKLPPFILQPLIENAIVHGIKYAEHDGFIHILAFEEPGRIVIKIIDNGVGLQASRAREHHTEHSTRKHLGLSLVERRLKVIDASLSLREHTDPAGQPEGTISEISIPMGHE